MAKKKSARNQIHLFKGAIRPRRRALILPRYLSHEASKTKYRGEHQDRALEIIKRWINLEKEGHLNKKKETQLDANFLHEVFGDALGYAPSTKSPEVWQLERNYSISDVGTADGALGNFKPGDLSDVVAVIELKGAGTDLDRDKFNGRTPVQQCWDYLNALPHCPWGIVSNFVTTRLYQRDKTPQVYEEFHLKDLSDLNRFREFYCLFETGGLLRSILGQKPRAFQLLEQTENRQQEVGDELYNAYSDNRLHLIHHLMTKHGNSLEQAIHIAQKILDRIIFVAFCEDRGLLPEKSIENTYKTIPPFSKVTNPRWRNFLDLFHAIDKGHKSLHLDTGYNGGLFRHDPDVDDLQLEDEWTNFFKSVGTYDFRDEINVDVLGHIFEKSITELEKIRLGGLFADPGENGEQPAPGPRMPKSAQRKRFGVYYTPPQFTRFIVNSAVNALIDERLKVVEKKHGIKPQQLDAEEPSEQVALYLRECIDTIRKIKICDPACGSGAFLIQAYELLEDRYLQLCNMLLDHDGPDVEDLIEEIPDIILSENLYGVDLSPQAVEITQLALWIRSARRGKTLADLSHNIICGNSLVTDSEIDERALDWQQTFHDVFNRPQKGFDCVIGNPPWERLKLQEREFFSPSAPQIAGAVNAATRRKRIVELESTNPELFERYTQEKNKAERVLKHVRKAGNFPLTAKGDINTYVLFAELARSLVSPAGRVGLLVPSGIATDNTTKEFFADLIESQSLIYLFDFENRKGIFPDVHRSFKFSTIVFGGKELKTKAADFSFFAHSMEDLADKNRHIQLSRKDLSLLNPNTKTCPIFRFRRDAELTKGIYRRVPILIDENREEGGNPWDIRFVTMFHQTNDAELFHDAEQLQQMNYKLRGNCWKKVKRTFLPLYEAKMVQAYDHRAAGVIVDKGNWVRQGQTEPTTLVDHQNPEFNVMPRWWVDEKEVEKTLKDWNGTVFLGFKDITSPTNQRTMIAAFIPISGVTNHFPLLLSDLPERKQLCLLANLNSLALDYIIRQKIGGVTLNFFIVKQFPMFPPDKYKEICPWNKRQKLEKWISERVLKLTCTANDMIPLAEAAGFDPPVHKWNPTERAKLQAELDAAYFLLYGINHDDMEYILSTFSGMKKKDEATTELFDNTNLIFEAYDNLLSRSKKA